MCLQQNLRCVIQLSQPSNAGASLKSTSSRTRSLPFPPILTTITCDDHTPAAWNFTRIIKVVILQEAEEEEKDEDDEEEKDEDEDDEDEEEEEKDDEEEKDEDDEEEKDEDDEEEKDEDGASSTVHPQI